MLPLNKLFQKVFSSAEPQTDKLQYSPFTHFLFALRILDLTKNWESIVGERLAAKTRPYGLKSRKLIIACAHPAYAQQLNIVKSKVLEKIYSTNPKLKRAFDDIKFVNNPEALVKQVELASQKKVVQKTHRPHRFAPEYQDDRRQIDLILYGIEDEELRTRIESLYLQKKYSS